MTDKAEEFARRTHLSTIKKYDAQIQEILETAKHVSVYIFDGVYEKWLRKGVDGPLFICLRKAEPKHSVFVLNRNSTNNHEEHIEPGCNMWLRGSFLLMKNKAEVIYGIWFSQEDDSARISRTLKTIFETVNCSLTPSDEASPAENEKNNSGNLETEKEQSKDPPDPVKQFFIQMAFRTPVSPGSFCSPHPFYGMPPPACGIPVEDLEKHMASTDTFQTGPMTSRMIVDVPQSEVTNGLPSMLVIDGRQSQLTNGPLSKMVEGIRLEDIEKQMMSSGHYQNEATTSGMVIDARQKEVTNGPLSKMVEGIRLEDIEKQMMSNDHYQNEATTSGMVIDARQKEVTNGPLSKMVEGIRLEDIEKQMMSSGNYQNDATTSKVVIDSRHTQVTNGLRSKTVVDARQKVVANGPLLKAVSDALQRHVTNDPPSKMVVNVRQMEVGKELVSKMVINNSRQREVTKEPVSKMVIKANEKEVTKEPVLKMVINNTRQREVTKEPVSKMVIKANEKEVTKEPVLKMVINNTRQREVTKEPVSKMVIKANEKEVTKEPVLKMVINNSRQREVTKEPVSKMGIKANEKEVIDARQKKVAVKCDLERNNLENESPKIKIVNETIIRGKLPGDSFINGFQRSTSSGGNIMAASHEKSGAKISRESGADSLSRGGRENANVLDKGGFLTAFKHLLNTDSDFVDKLYDAYKNVTQETN